MADRKGLRLLGWAYAALTLAVALVAVIVVTAQINTQVQARPDADGPTAARPQ